MNAKDSTREARSMRIAIVDDLVNERALLRNRLEQALNGRSVQTDI